MSSDLSEMQKIVGIQRLEIYLGLGVVLDSQNTACPGRAVRLEDIGGVPDRERDQRETCNLKGFLFLIHVSIHLLVICLGDIVD